MLSISTVSEGLTAKIRNAMPDIDDQKAETIEYGIYMAISEVTKVTLIIIISYFLGITKYAIATIALFGMLRPYIGGIHADTHIKCFITSSVTILSIARVSNMIHTNNMIFAIVALPLCLLMIYKYAPADNPNKPVKSKKQRKSLRSKGLIIITLFFITSTIVPYVWGNIISYTAVVACIMTTPALYRLFGNKYGNEGENS